MWIPIANGLPGVGQRVRILIKDGSELCNCRIGGVMKDCFYWNCPFEVDYYIDISFVVSWQKMEK